MPLFCMEAKATAMTTPSPTGATPTLPTPTAATPSATAVSATATPAGNSPHPYVHIRGHHLRAGCLGVGERSGIQQKPRAKILATAARRFLSKSKKTLNGLSTLLKVCVL